MKFKSLKEKLSFIISAVLFTVFLIIWVYYSSIIKEQSGKLSYQLMENHYLEYSSLLRNEIERIKSKNDVLALIIAKTTDEKKTLTKISEILRPVVNNTPSIYKITFAYYNINAQAIDSIGERTTMQSAYLNIINTPKGTLQNNLFPDDNLKLELFKKELSNFEKSVVFEVQHKNPTSYIPILTPVFSGKRYIGYIETCISTDWINEAIILNNKLSSDFITVYLSADNKIIASNSKDLIIGDPLKMICPLCSSKDSKNKSALISENDQFIYCGNVLQDESFAGNLTMCFVAPKDNLFAKFNYQAWKYFLVSISLLIIGIVVIYLIIAFVTMPFKQLIAFAKKVAQGDFECEHKDMVIKQKDEIGQLQTAFREISMSLKETTEVSKAIAAGDFSRTLKQKSKNDFLAQAINQMSNFLKTKIEKDKESRKEEEKQKWINKGLGLISEALKRNQDDTKNLANKLIKTLVEFLDVSLGGIYMKETDENETEVYRLVAAYAYSNERYIDRKFHAGESLVGSCVSEQRMIYMSSIPDGYITVLSGIGESSPKSLILIPLIYNNEVFGVLELASFRAFTENEQEFLQNAADNIASTLSLTQISSQTSNLLDKTRQQAKELERRDKEMKANLKKIRELQEETAKKESEMRAKITALNNSLLIVEYTVDGVLFDANDKFLTTMGYSLRELKGRNVLDMLNESERKELLHIIDTVKQGNFYETIVRRHTKHEKEKWLIATYTPVLDDKGDTISILFFATDITRIIRKEQTLFTQITEMKNEINLLIKDKYQIETKLHEKENEAGNLENTYKVRENDLIRKMEEQKERDGEKIRLYEQMISEIIENWDTHIHNAEKVIRDDMIFDD